MKLVASQIAAERGDEILFSGLDFELSSGELLTITGPNGAGKSTLLRIIAGLLKPFTGSITLQEEAYCLHPASWCHYLSTQNAMKPSLSVYDNLVFWAQFLGEQALSLEDALECVGISHVATLPFRVLSTGQRRRAALARLLISERPIWLLDEPTSGLDVQATTLVSTLINDHLVKGGMVIAATHLPLGVQEHHQCNIINFQLKHHDIQQEPTL